MTHILRTSKEYKTASLADECNSAYCESSNIHKIKHIKTYINLWKLALRGHLITDDQARDGTRNFLLTRTMEAAVKSEIRHYKH